MRYRLIALGLTAAMSFGAHAQSAGAIANTDVNTGAYSGASNAGVSNSSTNIFGASDGVKYSGHYKVLTNPGAPLGGMAAGFSGDNCANSAQKALSLLIASGGSADPVESRACNFRMTGGKFILAAEHFDNVGQHDVADRARAMGMLELCRAAAEMEPNDMHNCQLMGFVQDGENVNVKTAHAVPYYRTPERIEKREPGTYWKDGQQVDQFGNPMIDTKKAADQGSVDPTKAHQPT